jgi:hypothetical protein
MTKNKTKHRLKKFVSRPVFTSQVPVSLPKTLPHFINLGSSSKLSQQLPSFQAASLLTDQKTATTAYSVLTEPIYKWQCITSKFACGSNAKGTSSK